jgi:hypothetical protein
MSLMLIYNEEIGEDNEHEYIPIRILSKSSIPSSGRQPSGRIVKATQTSHVPAKF